MNTTNATQATVATPTISQDELMDIGSRHAEWMEDHLAGGERADFTEMDLRGLDFSDTGFPCAFFTGANCEGVDFSRADISDADFRRANCRGAKFERATAPGADFTDANLKGAGLSFADVDGAIFLRTNIDFVDFENVDLRDCDISVADLSEIKDDFFRFLANVRDEVPSLLKSLVGGSFGGRNGCLARFFAKGHGIDIDAFRDSGVTRSACEVWLDGIPENGNPADSQIATIAIGWLDEYMRTLAEALALVHLFLGLRDIVKDDDAS